MAAKSGEFASVRLPASLKRKVLQIGRLQRWTLSKTLCVLVEEAVGQREEHDRLAAIAAGTMEKYGKLVSSRQ